MELYRPDQLCPALGESADLEIRDWKKILLDFSNSIKVKMYASQCSGKSTFDNIMQFLWNYLLDHLISVSISIQDNFALAGFV